MKHKKVIIVAVICLLLVLIPLYLNHPNRKYRRAVDAFNKGQTSEAATLFEEVSTYKDSAMYLSYLKSLEQFKNGNYEDAEKGFRELGSFLDSSDLVNRCVQEQQVKRYGTALQLFEKQSYAEAGEIFRQLGSYEKSKEYAAYCNGMVLFGEGRYREAEDAFLQVSGFLDADSWIEASNMMEQETIYREAVSLFEDGKTAEARDLFQKIPGYEDASQFYRYTEGLVALEEKNYTVAATSFQMIPEFRDSAELARTSVERQISQQYQDAVKLFKENRYKEANAAFASISDYADSEYYIEYMAAVEELNNEKYPEAIEKLRRMETFLDSKRIADEAEKRYHTILYNSAMAHFEDENYAEALELFEKLGEYSDAPDYKAYLTGLIADAEEDYLKAYEAFESIPDFKDAKDRAKASRNAYLEQQYTRGVKAVSDGNLGEAAEAFSHVDGYRDTARYVAYINGRDALEREDYRKAEALFSDLGRFLDSRELMELCTEKLIPIRYEAAMEALAEDRYEDALKDLERIQGYRDADHYADYARVLQTAYVGDYQDALDMLDQMEDFPDKADLRVYIKAREAESKLDYEKAMELYQQIVSFRDSEKRLTRLPDMILDRDFDALADRLTARDWWNQRLMNEVDALLEKEYQVTNTTMKLRFLTLADTLLESGEFEHSYQLTERIVRQDESMAPKLLDIQYLFALTEMEKNVPEQAEWMLEELAEQDYPDAQALLEQCREMLLEKAQESGDQEMADYYRKKLESGQPAEEQEKAEGAENAGTYVSVEEPEPVSTDEDGEFDAQVAYEEGKAAFLGMIRGKLRDLVEEAEQMANDQSASLPAETDPDSAEPEAENGAVSSQGAEENEVTAEPQTVEAGPISTPDEADRIQESAD